MTWPQAIVEIIKAVFGLLSGLAWPVAVVLIVWWFQEEIAELIRRGFKFKGYGVEFETQEIFKKIEAEIRPEAVAQVKAVLVDAKSTASASVQPRYLEGLNLLMDRATSDPRNAIKQSWELLGGTVLRKANVSGENVQPDSEEIATSLKRLEANTQYSEDLIRSIRNLQQIARRVFYHSQWAYDPSPEEAKRYVLYSAAARNELGDKVG